MIVAATVCAPLIGIAQLQITLTPSDYNGFNVSCFGLKDGTLSAAVTGGTPPYTYTWSTAETTQSISGLAAGYYHLSVKDALSAKDDAEITLTEPNTMRVAANPHVFSNDYNISCYECSNGSIQVTVADGVAPYTFLWDDGPTNQNRWGLDQGFYQVTVSDANSCEALQVGTYISRPDRSDWTMGGNTGSDPETDYIGTADEQDVVLKSNATERLRIKSNGDVEVGSLTGTVPGLLVTDENGVLKRFSDSDIPVLEDVCPGHAYPWTRCGNSIVYAEYLGTNNAMPLFIKTNNVLRMTVSKDGKVGIGTVPPVGAVDGYRLYVEDGIQTRDVMVKLGTWDDYVFDEGYHLMPLDELREYLRSNHHMPAIPSAGELESRGGLELGAIAHALTRTVEEQALYILQLEERLAKMEQRMVMLETAK
ncbi:MAG: SprB repeat-containing protein [Flavobacteriales bacterium]|nr:SprB repeat-containing protein [Flavobacteriales bacterium]